MGRVAITAIAGLLGFVAIGPALAQTNLLDQGRGLLNVPGTTGGPATQRPSTPAAAPASGGSLSNTDMVSGLTDALKVGTERTVGRLGRADGYLKDKDVHIALSGALGQVQQALQMAGAGGLLGDLETRMNRAAEAAGVFGNTITAMTVNDARAIVNGPKDAATQYFKRETSKPLADAMRPIVERSLSDVGAVNSLKTVGDKYQSVPLGGALNFDMTGYVLDKALAGLFFYLAREEAAIRDNPAQRSTELLKKVFGG